MNSLRQWFSVALLITACLFTLGGCRTVDQAPASARVVGFRGLSKLYRQSAAPHRRAFRKPIRDERARAIRLLAAKAGRMADDSHTLPVTPAATDARATIAARENDAVAAYRDSLRSLEAAARQGDVYAIRAAYRQAAQRHRIVDDVDAATFKGR